MTKTVEEAFMIKNENGFYYNGGYSYKETEDLFSQESGYAMTFSSEEEALEAIMNIKAHFSYLVIEKIYTVEEYTY